VLVDGRLLYSYARAYVRDGRVFVPVAPVMLRLADRAWFDGKVLVLQRAARHVRVRIPRGDSELLATTFVAAGPLIRQLGDDVVYDAHGARLQIRTPRPAIIATPTPYVAPAVTLSPREVFTHSPAPMPRPTWNGPPLPRRTPLPNPPPATIRLPRRSG
jgi:hypothetical protein